MGNLKYFSLLMVAGMFAACSDNLENPGNENDGPKTGEGYVKVAINTPTTSGNSSRTTDGDSGKVDLEDGEENEYKVTNAILVFFKAGSGKSEADATFVKAYALSDLQISGSSEIPQVSGQVSIITEAPKVDESEKLYVLAILNYNSSVLSVDNGVLKINGNGLTVDTSKLSDLQKKVSATINDESKTNATFVSYFTGNSNDMFTMTNAPLSDKAGTSGNMTNAKAYTLVPVKVYDTEAAAIAGDVAKIYVERVVAKVTLKSTSTHMVNGTQKIKVTNEDGVETDDIVEITGWCLNVTNNSTKLVRDVNGFSATGWLNTTPTENMPERFAGTRSIDASFGIADENNNKYYRIYWAQDCNYYDLGSTDVTVVNSDFTTYTSTQGTFSPEEPAWNTQLATANTDNACYCLENTMNFSEQKDDRTTGVLIKTNYWTKFEGEEDASLKSFFICGTSSTKYPEKQVGESDQNHTKAFVDKIIEQANTLITTEGNRLSTEDPKGLTLKTDLKSGTYTDVTQVFTFAETNTESEKYKAQLAAVNAAVGGKIYYYKEGKNFYYSSLIRHFYDDEGVGLPDGGVSSANDYTLKHLGRYGVVRNNWYEIDIQSIGGPGDPDIDEPDGNTDDSTEGYIKCSINVLSWAKRSQGVEL